MFKSRPWLKSTPSLKLILPDVVTSITKLVTLCISLTAERFVVEPLKPVVETTENVLKALLETKVKLSVQLMLQLYLPRGVLFIVKFNLIFLVVVLSVILTLLLTIKEQLSTVLASLAL